MTVTIVAFAWRKAGTSPAEFKDYYEKKHIPLLLSIAGKKFPVTHTRHYIQRTSGGDNSDKTNAAHPAVAFVGKAEDFEYDAVVELVFEDGEKFQEFITAVRAPEAAAQIAKEEQEFLERMTVASIDQIAVTHRP